MAQLSLAETGGLLGLSRAATHELPQVKGIGQVNAAQIKAALELGRRAVKSPLAERSIIRAPTEAANLPMVEMSNLEQEHMRVIVLDTRNHVLSMPTIHIGSLNHSVLRVGELFRTSIRENAAPSLWLTTIPRETPPLLLKMLLSLGG